MFGVAASNYRVLEDAAESIVPTADGKMLNYSWPTDGGAVCFFLYTASRICCHVLDHRFALLWFQLLPGPQHYCQGHSSLLSGCANLCRWRARAFWASFQARVGPRWV